jgi:hypothetical protein
MRATRRSTERIAKQRIVEGRLQIARQLAVDAYAVALDAVEWLHDVRVEDSVLEPHSITFDPQYKESIRRLRKARLCLHKVSALTTTDDLSLASADVARQLGVLDDAWDRARTWAKWMHDKPDNQGYKKDFMKHMEILVAARKSLTGTNEMLPSQEIAAGGITDDSLFGRLRSAIRNSAT